MKIHEFGEWNRGNIVMIHGACMSWDMFMPAVDILSRQYHIYAVGVPGHDLTTNEEFTSVESIANRIELTLVRDGLGRIDLLYGLSMGGSIALRMLADDKIPTDRAVIDAGITPRESTGFLAGLFRGKDAAVSAAGKRRRSALAAVYPPARFSAAVVDKMFAVVMKMSENTTRNIYNSSDNYAMPEKFPELNAETEYWYGEAEETARKADISYVQKHIPGVKLRKLEGMSHAQYALSCPEQLAYDLLRRLQ